MSTVGTPEYLMMVGSPGPAGRSIGVAEWLMMCGRVVAIPTAKNIIAAIVEKALSDDTFNELVPGGLGVGEADHDKDRPSSIPYGSIISIGRPNDDYASSTNFLRYIGLQFDFVAYTVDELDSIASCMNDLFNHKMEPLLFRDGTHGQVISGGLHYTGEARSRDGQPLHHGYVEVLTVHNRTFTPR